MDDHLAFNGQVDQVIVGHAWAPAPPSDADPRWIAQLGTLIPGGLVLLADCGHDQCPRKLVAVCYTLEGAADTVATLQAYADLHGFRAALDAAVDGSRVSIAHLPQRQEPS